MTCVGVVAMPGEVRSLSPVAGARIDRVAAALG
jgi:hypothetical protein